MAENKRKIVTFSFDDGIYDDIRLIEIMNKYGIKGTFNLNSAKLSACDSWVYNEQKEVKHINYCEHTELYSGHEVACHGYTHPFLQKLDKETLYNEVALDKKILSCLFNCEIEGMAYPFGTYSEEVIEALKNCGIKYCRTVNSTHGFSLPENPLLWNPTCHYMDSEIMSLAEKFISSDSDELQLFYIWGHSYELATETDWENFQNLCKALSEDKNIYFCTNAEALSLIEKQKEVKHYE